MKLKITGRGINVPENVKEFALKRLGKLEKMLSEIVEMEIVISKEKFNFLAEGNVISKLGSFNGKETGKNEKAAVKALFDVLEKLSKKEKEKIKGRKRKKRKTVLTGQESSSKFIPSNSYSMKPISIEEAEILLSESEDPVFVFRNIDTGGVTVIFKKGEGKYGIIEIEK